MALYGLDLLTAPSMSRLTASTFAVDAGAIVSAAAAAGFLFKPIRRDAARALPIDPDNPVHALALVLAVTLFGMQVTALVFTDLLATIGAQPPQTLLDTLLTEAPLFILAAAGVGIFIRRRVPAAASRLGLVRPAWWHVVLSIAAAGVFLAVAIGLDSASHVLTPDVARRVDATSQHVFGRLTSPLDVAALAVLAGVCEELLFRGALQPRFGLIPTALLFASIHSEYGFSLTLAAVFVLAIGLGLIRKYLNTTASMTAHVSYDLLAGSSIGGAAMYGAIAIEAVLVAVTMYALWSRRRRAPVAKEP